ncbi:MAG: TnpV protein [Clostridia bacterium]|nr:TnpV protein [Clostridia bacterium]
MTQNKKMINGKLHIYCNANGKYYPKFKIENGIRMELDEKYFIYVLEGDFIDESLQLENDNLLNIETTDNDIYVLSIYYGQEREKFLRNNYTDVYIKLLESGTLNNYLREIDKQAIAMEDRLTSQYAGVEGVTEALKKADMTEWVSRMNNIKYRVREVVQHTLIYTESYIIEN